MEGKTMTIQQCKTIFTVHLEYNIESDSAVQALDDVLGKHPLSPISFSCHPVETDEYDE
jgi:hypothetical protein